MLSFRFLRYHRSDPHCLPNNHQTSTAACPRTERAGSTSPHVNYWNNLILGKKTMQRSNITAAIKTERTGPWNHLVDALAANKAVAFVGAGVSVAAGLPTWDELLRKGLNEASRLLGDHGNPRARQLLESLPTEGSPYPQFADEFRQFLEMPGVRHRWHEFRAQCEGALRASGPGQDLLQRKRFLQSEAMALQNPELRKVEQLIAKGEPMLAATLLRSTMGERFRLFLKSALAIDRTEPSDQHRSISRLPFSQVITTNLDDLLERAYQPTQSDLDPDPDEIMSRLRQDEFCVIKLHGTVANLGKIVIDDNDYRNASRAEALRQCLELIFLTKTVLFVGHSLRDPDLTERLYDLKTRFRNFGPHYVILSSHDVTPNYEKYLQDSFNVRVITYDYEHFENRTASLVDVMSRIHGDVAQVKTEGDISYQDRTSPVFEKRISSLIEHTVSVLGPFRLDICLLDNRRYWIYGAPDHTLDHSETADVGPCLRFSYSWGPTDQSFKDITPTFRASKDHPNPPHIYRNPAPSIVWPSSVIWNSYYRNPGPESIPNVFDPAVHRGQPGREGSYESRYRMGHPEVRSELTCPIESGGFRLGVLNLESNLTNAFSAEHVRAASAIAKEVGTAIEALWIQDVALSGTFRAQPNASRYGSASTGEGSPFDSDIEFSVKTLLEGLGSVAPRNVQFRLFKHNYHDGNLEEVVDRNDPPRITFLPTSKSFAGQVFTQTQILYSSDWERDCARGLQIDRDQAVAHSVGKDILGIPIIDRGTPIGSFTAWSTTDHFSSCLSSAHIELLSRAIPLLTRLASLHHESNYEHEFLSLLSHVKLICERADTVRAAAWKTRGDLAEFSAMSSVAASIVEAFGTNGPKRLRIFKSDPEGTHFHLVGEAPQYQRNYHDLQVSGTSDSLLSFTRNRALRLPGAMLLHRAVFFGGKPKGAEQGPYTIILESGKEPIRQEVWLENAARYGRHPNCGFYSCPISIPVTSTDFIVRNWHSKVLGILIADNCDGAARGGDGTAPLVPRHEFNEQDKPPRPTCDLPIGRTRHELIRLKLEFFASLIGAILAEGGPTESSTTEAGSRVAPSTSSGSSDPTSSFLAT